MPENREGQGMGAERESRGGATGQEEREIRDLLGRLNVKLDASEATKSGNKESSEPVLVIDLQALVYRLIERWAFILSAAVATAVVVAIVVFTIVTPMYEATSKLYVLSSSDSAVNLSDLQIGSYLTSDYQEVFNTWEVHQQVIDNLGLEYTYEGLASRLTINNPSDTRILSITFRSDDAQEAKDVANEYASVARRYISLTMKTEEPMVMSEALLPVKPVSPRKALDIFIGFILGGVLAAGIVVVMFIQDDKVKTSEDILKYGEMVTLAVVPEQQSDSDKKRSERK